MAPFRTAFNGYAIKFSPFEEGRVAVATAQNFGIIGNGRQYVLQVGLSSVTSSLTFCIPMSHQLLIQLLEDFAMQMTPNGLVEVAEFDTKDGIYDCAWSEVDLFIPP